MGEFYNLDKNECLKILNTNINGLKESEAQNRLLKNGKNIIFTEKKKNYFLMFLKQFLNVMTIVLFCAGVISTIFAIIEKSSSEAINAGIIFFIVLLNGVIGFVQEFKAEKSLQNIKKLSFNEAKVLREGVLKRINNESVVIGDVIFLEAGDIVPADVRIIENVHLKIDESSLTGESNPVEKSDKLISNKTPLADRSNMAFKGCNVTSGRGVGVVVKIGMETEIGKIAKLLNNNNQNQQTPIQRSLKKLGLILTFIATAIALTIFIIEFTKPNASVLNAFMIAIAIAVAAIPESLPAIVTIIMAIGVSKLAKKGAIVKNLSSVETLGCCEIICSDKTGTLTENKMKLESIYYNNKIYNKIYNKKLLKKSKELDFCFKIMSLCNTCVVQGENVVGDPTEVALCDFALKNNYNKEELLKKYKLIDELPFDSKRKLMTTISSNGGENISFTKGGIEEVLNKCKHIMINEKKEKLTPTKRKDILKVADKFARRSLRVLGLAFGYNQEEDLIFVGLVGIIDPPRKEAFKAVKACFESGMKPIMITGDHKETAFNIAKQLGIAYSKKQVLQGVELDKLSDKQFLKIIKNIKVFARVTPENKDRIVKAYKKIGKIVAMTGDGVNDAPCIKSADIGIGMGITGTDISKEAADIVLSDDNFATIILAVKEGRIIYKNIEKTVKFLLSANGSEMLSILIISIIFPNFAFLLPIHILFINLITDSLPSIALGFEPPESNIMKIQPRDSNKHLLSGLNGVFVVFFSIVQALIIISVYIIGIKFFGENSAVTMAFYTFNIVQIFYIMSARTENYFFKNNLFKNKMLIISLFISAVILLIIAVTPLNQILFLTDLSFKEWFICFALSFSIFPISELYKFITNFLSKKVEKNK